jgi:CheY-like chemotaxis protein
MKSINCILVVDDSQMDLWLALKIIELLNICGLTLKAKSGNEALKVLEEYTLANGKFPEIIIVDLQMPGMNGNELIKRIKDHPQFNSGRTQIIVQTAHIDPDIDIPNINENEIKYVLMKPLDKGELLHAIDSFQNGKEGRFL